MYDAAGLQRAGGVADLLAAVSYLRRFRTLACRK